MWLSRDASHYLVLGASDDRLFIRLKWRFDAEILAFSAPICSNCLSTKLDFLLDSVSKWNSVSFCLNLPLNTQSKNPECSFHWKSFFFKEIIWKCGFGAKNPSFLVPKCSDGLSTKVVVLLESVLRLYSLTIVPKYAAEHLKQNPWIQSSLHVCSYNIFTKMIDFLTHLLHCLWQSLKNSSLTTSPPTSRSLEIDNDSDFHQFRLSSSTSLV